MFYVIAEALGWVAACFRAAGMLAKKPNTIKWLVSVGNACFAINGLMESNWPLVASNVLCLVLAGVDAIRQRKEKK